MKKYIDVISVIILLTILGGCSQSDEVNDIPPIAPTESNLGIFPKPSSGWKGESDPYNTTGWTADVMPYYENGKFHMFFLHDAQNKPAGEGFHDIHAFETEDFVNYDYEGRAIDYGNPGQPDFAVGTGSLIKVDGTYYYYYTGHNGTSAFLEENPRESVLLATSDDLENWTKKGDFKITAPEGYYDFEFRDPHVLFNEEVGEYWMLVSAQTDARKAVILLFTSPDPSTDEWAVQEPLYTTKDEDNYLMMEVPDLFKMGDYWYLIFSENWKDKITHYRVATSSKGPWEKPANDMVDGQFFYAGKAVSDGNNRYLAGWTARKSPETNSGTKDFGGNLVVHELHQQADGKHLAVKAPSSVSSVFANSEVPEIKETSNGVTENENGFQIDASEGQAKIVFQNLSGTSKVSGNISVSQEANAGIFLGGNDNPSESFRIQLEPRNNKIIAINNGNFENVVYYDFDSDTEYHFELYVEDSVAVLYLNGEVALSNRIYNIYDSAWGLYGEFGLTDFGNILINQD
ncbi:glycoside hydrolase family 32 protein [Christiangramia portivictoriae]|uniref:glycoside hydrolase family 32 protein n=1 Tax=Christiangramia portivictoriae TaxID=326069 RepID=UPI00041C9DEE|nr:glycoside hydrolase family 32 protein [Christiangramia portivictoriae]